jgi:hypothetical protein
MNINAVAYYPYISFKENEILTSTSEPVTVRINIIKGKKTIRKIELKIDNKKEIIEIGPDETIKYEVKVKCHVIGDVIRHDWSCNYTSNSEINNIVSSMERFARGSYNENITRMKHDLTIFHECMRKLLENKEISLKDVVSIPSFALIISNVHALSSMIVSGIEKYQAEYDMESKRKRVPMFKP